MSLCQSLPLLWLLSDARNDACLEDALHMLPHGSGFVFRHYHLEGDVRRARYAALAKVARQKGHWVILSADRQEQFEDWGSDGIYGAVDWLNGLAPPDRPWLATAHNSEEMQQAINLGASGIFLSPVFPTASHPGSPTLGVFGFRVLAQQSTVPVIALGGMNAQRALELDWPRWGAIDSLVSTIIA